MSRQDLIDYVAEDTQISKAEASRVLDSILKGIEKGLIESKEVTFVGFGKFSVKTREAREGINPSTKEKIQIPAKNAVTFKAGKKLKDSVQ